MRVKRLFAFVIAILFVFSLLAACAADPDPVVDVAANGEEAPAAPAADDDENGDDAPADTTDDADEADDDDDGADVATPAANPWLHRFDPPITLTVHAVDSGAFSFLDGEDIMNNSYTRWVRDEVGIIFEAEWIAPDGDTNIQQLNLAAAAGDLPDIIFGTNVIMGRLATAGLLLPLDDLIETYSSPLTQYVFNQNYETTQGMFFAPFTMDGQIMAIPQAIDSGAFWSTNWIRSDILEELGMDVPETLEELEAILAAYVELYPDGVGYLLSRDVNHSELQLVGSAFEAYPGMWQKMPDGTLAYGSIQPAMRETLEVFARWFENGWIDQEFMVKDGGRIMETISAGNFMTHRGMWWNVFWPFPDFFTNNPEGMVEFFPILTGPDGRQGITVNTTFHYGTAVSANTAHPEAIFYLYNEKMDSWFRNNFTERERGIHDAMAAVGYVFKYQPEPRHEPLNPEETERYRQVFNYNVEGWGFFNTYESHANLAFGIKGEIGYHGSLDFVDVSRAYLEGRDPGELEPRLRQWLVDWENNNIAHIIAPNMVYWDGVMQSPILHPNRFAGLPTPTMVERLTFLDSLESETFAQIIAGQLPLEAFDSFVEEWLANGGEQITEEVNEWYRSLGGN